ncbi:hypothetical protein B0O99DRAFT_650195 [Bisporella sp. PMI_857]|nr:hypothetical protein B0O99DRAFT_650195 [Bisporella sp. PMI_857]
MPTYHVGQRVSFKSALCTIQYIGPVEGTDREWLGVEWDDPKRGKHNGENNGRKYFTCKSSSPTAASFIAITRNPDLEQSFIEAVREKYATDIINQPFTIALDKPIEISGKTVEEVGFEKIKKQQSQLHELKIVLVDGYRINKAGPRNTIKYVCPKIMELDLSRNLFEDCSEIIKICEELDSVRSLRLNGNRLEILSADMEQASQAFDRIQELELDDILSSWEDICLLTQTFKSLSKLTASSNSLGVVSSPLLTTNLRSLTLEYNDFTNLSELLPLAEMASLESLHLKGNRISRAYTTPPSFGRNLCYIDLSYNQVTDWEFLDAMTDIFPGMTALRFSNNPIYDNLSKETGSATSIDDGYMLTLARLGNLKTLNFSNITSEDRRNGEMFYLSRIGQAMAKVPEAEEHTVASRHKRYAELCETYGEPTVVRKPAETINPDFLEARLIKFTFYLRPGTNKGQEEAIIKVKEIPKSFDIYRVKGIVGRLFGLRPLSLRLVWETGEWDPVAGYEEEEESDDSNDEGTERIVDAETAAQRERGKWMKREVEIEDSTRQVGFCVDGMEATVRVELR